MVDAVNYELFHEFEVGGVFDGAAWKAKYGRFDVAGHIDSDAEKQHWLGEAFKRVMAAWPARGDHYDYLNKAGA